MKSIIREWNNTKKSPHQVTWLEAWSLMHMVCSFYKWINNNISDQAAPLINNLPSAKPRKQRKTQWAPKLSQCHLGERFLHFEQMQGTWKKTRGIEIEDEDWELFCDVWLQQMEMLSLIISTWLTTRPSTANHRYLIIKVHISVWLCNWVSEQEGTERDGV